jgi:hypothetical protein
MGGLGFHPRVIERPRNKLEAISAARCAFVRCQFEEEACAQGLKRLRAYGKEWDEDRGVWKDRPRHDDASHGADAFLTFASLAADTNLRRREAASTARSSTGTTAGWCRGRPPLGPGPVSIP